MFVSDRTVAPMFQVAHVSLSVTFFLPWGQLTGRPAHVDKGVEVSLQALVRLPLQSGQCSELRPVEGFSLGVVDHPERRHGAVKVCLLSTSPPETRDRGDKCGQSTCQDFNTT